MRFLWKRGSQACDTICETYHKDGQGRTPADIAPGTKVYELVEELVKYLPEEIRIKFQEKTD